MKALCSGSLPLQRVKDQSSEEIGLISGFQFNEACKSLQSWFPVILRCYTSFALELILHVLSAGHQGSSGLAKEEVQISYRNVLIWRFLIGAG